MRMLRLIVGDRVNLLWEPCRDAWLMRIDPGQLDQICRVVSLAETAFCRVTKDRNHSQSFRKLSYRSAYRRADRAQLKSDAIPFAMIRRHTGLSAK